MSADGSGSRVLVLLRHGRTAWNHEQRIQGQLEAELDDTGREQAARVAPLIAALRPEALWCSDLVRARDTARYLAEATGLDPVPDARLREYGLGSREGLTHAEYAQAHPEEFAEFRRGNFDVVADGESTPAVRARMLAVAADMLAATTPGGTVVAVSHGAAIRVAVAGLLGWPDGAVHTLRGLDNCGWVVLDQAGDRPLRLVAYNRVAGEESGAAPATVADPDFASRDAVG